MARSPYPRARRRAVPVLLGVLAAGAAQAGGLPRVASTNLCTDQLVLNLADAAQIVTLSWLSADAHESVMPEAAAHFPLNYGTAEELLRLKPDVIVGGEYTRPFALSLVERLGMNVVTVEPASGVDGIARNLRAIGAAIGRERRAEQLVAALRERAAEIAARAPPARPGAVVVRPGGYTVGRGSLADELMRLAGLTNLAAEHGLDRWGSLSVETLLRSRPDLLVLVDYHRDSPSLANAVFRHPALERIKQRTPTVSVDAAEFACGMPQSLEAAASLQAAARRVVHE